MAVTVGAVYVDVLPSARDFVKRMVADILPEADKAGEEIGRKVGESLGKEAGRQAAQGIEDGVEEADVEADSAKKGKRAGGAFARTFKAELEAALRSLPDIDIDADNAGALAEVAEIRAALTALSKQTVGVDIDADDALRAVRNIRDDLLAVQNETVDVDFDVNQALGALGQLEKRMVRTFQDSQGSFARSIRGALDNAVKALPDIKLSADNSDVEHTIAGVRRWLDDLSNMRIDIDISSGDLIREITEMDAMLGRLVGPHTVRVQADIDAARSALAKITGVAEDEGTAAGGAFMQRMRAELLKASQTLPEIRPGVDTTQAMAIVGRLRAQLATLSAQIGVDVDAATALTKLETLRSIAEQLDRDDFDIDVDVRVDLRNVVTQLAAITAASKAAEEALDQAVGDAGAGKVSRFRLILAAVAALLPIIAAAVIALPGAFALVLGPVLAIAAGVDGIKKAFSELTPTIDQVQKAASAAFEQGLEGTVNRLRPAIGTLQDDIVRTAEAITFVADEISRTATTAKSLNGIQDNFSLIDQVIRSSAPALELFTENIIRLTTIGLQGMNTFGEEMRQVGEAWAAVITRLQASGAAEAAVRALFQILAELLNLAAGLTEFGAVLGATFGPALAAAISGIAAVFSGLAQVLDSLPEPLRTMASAATTVGLVMLVLGSRITGAATSMRLAAVAAGTTMASAFRTAHAATLTLGSSVTGLGVASRIAAPGIGALAVAGRALLAVIGGPIGLAITAVVVGLSLLGGAQADTAAQTEAHAVASQKLTEALRANAGEVDNTVLRLARQTAESAGARQAADDLGFSLSGMVRTVSQGGPAYDGLIAKLREMANANVIVGRVATESGLAALKQKEAAQTLLPIMESLRGTFADAAAENAELSLRIRETGGSLVTGVGDAARLQEAFKTLKDEMSDVKSIGDALYITMIQLSGQAIPLGLAQGALGEAVRKTGESFKEYAEATKKSGDALLDNTGKVNVASEAGYKLTQAIDGQVKATYQVAAAAFDAAGGTQNIATASAAARREVEFARAAFIKQVAQFGITGKAAEELADRYGLIPDLVVTQLATKGLPQVSQDLLNINQLVQGLPGQKVINIGSTSPETIAQLQAVGLQVRQLTDGTYTIDLSTQQARDAFNALVQAIEHPTPPTQTPVGANTQPGQQGVQQFQQGIQSGAPTQMPVGVDGKPLERGMPEVRAQVTNPPGGPAAMPVETDPSKVPPQVGEIQQGIQGTVAQMPINPIKGSGWDPDLAAIRDSVVMTVGTLPLNPIKGSGWDVDLAGIRDSVLLTVATMPINPVTSPEWPAQLQAIKDSLTAPPYAQLLIDVARAPTWAASLAALTGPLTLPPYSLILIDVGRAPTWATSLAAITGPLMLPPYTAMLLVPAKAPTWDAALLAIRTELAQAPLIWVVFPDIAQMLAALDYVWNLVATNPLVWLVWPEIQTMLDALSYIWDLVVQNPLVWVVFGEFSQLIAGLEAIANWVASNPLYWQIIPVFGGFGGGGGGGGGGGSGMGFIAHGAYVTAMATGGVINKALTPMRNDVAQVVPPNTWRVMGDRMRGDESFIPIIDTKRSHSILEYTAAKMGRTILPQASGSYMTQQSGAFASAVSEDWGATGSLTSTSGPLIGQVIAPNGATATDLADEVMFRLRVADYGGLHNVGH